MALERSLAPYPGRGIAHHVADDGSTGWIYFVTGRSASSRAREICADGESLVVRPTNPETPADALRHYRCVKPTANGLIVGNGDHVDVLADALASGATVEAAAQLLSPEPDPPLFTPRIALVVGEAVHLIAVRGSEAAPEHVVIDVQRERSTIAVLTTYSGTGSDPAGAAPLVSGREPRPLADVAEAIWGALDPDLRVALVAGRAREPHPVASFSDNPR